MFEKNEKPSRPAATVAPAPAKADDAALRQELRSLSYSYPDDPAWRRLLTRGIEILCGQPFLIDLYLRYRADKRAGETFFEAALRLLRIELVCDETMLASWPEDGPLVVVCNHPFGVIDGLLACRFAEKARGDFRILTNAVLDRAEEMRPYLLPVDFSGTSQALKTNLASRAGALAHLKSGGCVVLFPAGAVATTPTPWAKETTDFPWKNFAARLILQARADVALVFFEGRNSRLFQIVSHIGMTARLALFVHEIRRMIGKRVVVRLGPVLSFSTLTGFDRPELLRHLRQRLYAIKK